MGGRMGGWMGGWEGGLSIWLGSLSTLTLTIKGNFLLQKTKFSEWLGGWVCGRVVGWVGYEYVAG